MLAERCADSMAVGLLTVQIGNGPFPEQFILLCEELPVAVADI